MKTFLILFGAIVLFISTILLLGLVVMVLSTVLFDAGIIGGELGYWSSVFVFLAFYSLVSITITGALNGSKK